VPYALSTRLLHQATGDAGEGKMRQGRASQPRLRRHGPLKTAVRQVNEPRLAVYRGSMTV